LCRHTNRNPALIGPAGTGKTAIVEGLAQRVVAGEVPRRCRGSGLSCIGATTDDEYRTFIQRDRALERRFRPIAVGEMSLEDSFVVLKARRDHLRELRGVEVPDDVSDLDLSCDLV
jgi:ATP-dependent Clp protease ATP-binding subunit ClpA